MAREAIVIPPQLTDALVEGADRIAVENYGSVLTPGFINVTVATPAEISVTLAATVQYAQIGLESNFGFRIAASSGATLTLYQTIPHGFYCTPQLKDSASKTLYIRTIRASEVVQVLTWS